MKSWLRKVPGIIGKGLKKAGDLYGKLQTAGMITMTILAVYAFITKGCSKQEVGKLAKKITGLDIERDFLKREIDTKNDRIYYFQKDSARIHRQYDSLLQENQKTHDQSTYYRDMMERYRGEVVRISEDSTYNLLQNVYYAFGGAYKPYGFNGPQVKAIYQDKIQSNTKDSLIASQQTELDQKDNLLANREAAMVTESAKTAETASIARSYSDLVDKTEEKADLTKKQLRRQKFDKAFWRLSAIAGWVVAIFETMILVI